MSISGAIRRAIAALTGRGEVKLPQPAPLRSFAESPRLVLPGAKKLITLIELEIRRIHGYLTDETGADIPELFIDHHNSMMTHKVNIVAELGEDTIAALLRASREPDFSITNLLGRYNHIQEDGIWKRALFYTAFRDYRVDSYEMNIALDRLIMVDPAFSTSYANWDEATLKHANAVLRVITHFVKYKGYPSLDTSIFLRDEPEMADQVIEYIERRGIGQKGFNLEVFNMMRQNSAPVLNDGVL